MKIILNILAGCSVAYAAASTPGSSDSPLNLNSYRTPLSASTPGSSDSPLNLNSYRIPLSSYGGEKGDDSFQRNTLVIVANLTKRIQTQPQQPAAKICNVAAKFRGELAQATKTGAAKLFGAPRGGELAREIDVTPLRKFPLMEQKAKKLYQRFASAPQNAWQESSSETRVRIRTEKVQNLERLLAAEKTSPETSVPSYADVLPKNLVESLDVALGFLSLAPTEWESDRYYDLGGGLMDGVKKIWLKSTDKEVVLAVHHLEGKVEVASAYFPHFPDDTFNIEMVDACFFEVESMIGNQWLPTTSFMFFTTKGNFDRATVTLLHPSVGLDSKPGSFQQHLNYCEQLLTKACNPSSRNIGTIAHWYYWACKTMPWTRGSAAINGWTLSALLQAEEYSLNLPSKAFRLLDEIAQTSLTFEDFMIDFTSIVVPALVTSTTTPAGGSDAAGLGPTAAAADSPHNNRSTDAPANDEEDGDIA